jgi:hypothetical protein
MGIISSTFINGIRQIRELEAECEKYRNYFVTNEMKIAIKVKEICEDVV